MYFKREILLNYFQGIIYKGHIVKSIKGLEVSKA